MARSVPVPSSGESADSRPAVVAIGGGHGLSRALGALIMCGLRPTAVVTVADDGGSSGRLREDLDIIAPGDLRMALLTLARNHDLARALGHRFRRGSLEGHALGNLLLVGLAEQAGGDFVAALDRAAALLEAAGRVLPSTTEQVVLHARIGGVHIDGQVRVATAPGPIEEMWLEPLDAPACVEAVEAILQADTVVLGPGSLFTSIIANLLVKGIGTALAKTKARIVYVANLTTQLHETSGLDAQAHVQALLDAVPGLVLDTVIVHAGPPGGGPGAPIVGEVTHTRVGAIRRADLALRSPDGSIGSGHDPARLAQALAPLVASAP